MVTVNCTVCHLQEAVFFHGKITFNANSVTKTSSVSLQHCADHRTHTVQCLCNCSATPALNSVVSDNYAHIWRRYWGYLLLGTCTHACTNCEVGDKQNILHEEAENGVKG